MTAERDMLIALMRQLYANGHLDAADISTITDEVDAKGGEEQSHLAHLTRLIVIEEAIRVDPPERLDVAHRRRQMVLKTQWLESKKGDADSDQ